MEGHDRRKCAHEKLLRASTLLTLFTLPIGNRDWPTRINNRLRGRLLRATRSNRKLNHGLTPAVLVTAVRACNIICNLESEKLVQERVLVANELQEFVRVSDALSRRHQGCIDNRVEVPESLFPFGGPDLVETDFDRICCIVLLVLEALLEIGNTVDGLQRSINPAGSSLIAKSK